MATPLIAIPGSWSTGTLARPAALVHYTRTGDGRKPALVLLHGAMDDGLCWFRLAREFEADFDVVMPDARGHGATRGTPTDAAAGPFTMSDMVDDVAALIQQLDLAPATVVGHSMGAQIATELAATHPELVGRVVLEDPAFGALAARGPRIVVFGAAMLVGWLWMRTRSPEQIRRLVDRAFPAWSDIDKDSWASAQHTFARRSFRSLYRAFDRRRDWAGYLRRIQAPTLLVTADRGLVPIGEAQAILAELPKGAHVHVPGAGHNIRRDNYPAFTAALRDFLSGGSAS